MAATFQVVGKGDYQMTRSEMIWTAAMTFMMGFICTVALAKELAL